MQHRAIRLMASKLAVAGIIEGNFTDEGLAAMSDCTDMTTALARELTQGIKNEVEDLSAVLKKMAKLKSPNISDEIISSKIVTTSSPVVDLYDQVAQENIENIPLEKLLEFITADFPNDFDPFAEEIAA